jgi:hypothetical protein
MDCSGFDVAADGARGRTGKLSVNEVEHLTELPGIAGTSNCGFGASKNCPRFSMESKAILISARGRLHDEPEDAAF